MATQSNNSVNQSIKIAEIGRDIIYIKDELKSIGVQLNSQYVTKEEFEPIKRVTYGVVGLALVAIVGALLALVLK